MKEYEHKFASQRQIEEEALIFALTYECQLGSTKEKGKNSHKKNECFWPSRRKANGHIYQSFACVNIALQQRNIFFSLSDVGTETAAISSLFVCYDFTACLAFNDQVPAN